MQKFTDEPLTTCPDCGGTMHKLISQTSFVLKGTGWYVTDYARAEKKKTEKTDMKKETLKETKTETKAETTAKK